LRESFGGGRVAERGTSWAALDAWKRPKALVLLCFALRVVVGIIAEGLINGRVSNEGLRRYNFFASNNELMRFTQRTSCSGPYSLPQNHSSPISKRGSCQG
jgi:hypothetical protein